MALITNTDSSVLPYNDKQMAYDLDRQFYVMTLDGVRELTGIDLISKAGSEQEANFILYEASQDLMNYISRYSLYSSYKYKVWLMAKDATLRPIIKRILADQIRYYVRSGAGVIKDMHGINIGSGKAMDIATLRNEVLVSASVEQQLAKSGLLYTGTMYYSDYSDDGTW